MDSNSSDHSPPLSENTGNSWIQCWENEIGLVSGLNLGCNNELNGLVEDKEIAARAVAFVVNSTRKGIVPLCADVAGLLRAKRSLEKKVFMLKCRNESLRSSSASMVTSHSTSPTPPSLNSYLDRTSFPDPNSNVQEGSRPCSRCSQCSSTISNSPKSDKAHGHKLSGYTYQQPSAGDNSSKQETTSSHSKPPNGITTQAVVHAAPDLDTEQNITRERKNSLPEIVSEPNRELPKTSATVSKEVQCAFMPSLDCSLEERFFETMKLNSKLAEDLGVARKEIEMLKGRLKELEMNHLARQCMEQMYTEYFDVNPDVEEKISPSLPATVAKSTSSTSKFEMPNGSSKRKPAVPKKPVLTAYSSPLPGCRCSSCEEMILSAISTTMQPTSEPRKFPINPRLHIQVDDHVVVKRERTGHIRYIGHLDKIDQPNSVFVGLELDAPVGQHDGFFNGKRYFQCAKDHAIFVPFRDVLCQVKQEFLKSSYSNLPEVIQSETESDGSPQPEHQSSLGKSYKVWKVRHRKTDLCSVQNKIERNSSSMTETGAPNCSLGRRPWITECCIHNCSVPHCNYNKFNCYHIDMQENERFTGC